MKTQKHIIGLLFTVLFIIAVSPISIYAECLVSCEQNESGLINIADTYGSSDNAVSITVEISLASNKVDALGFDVQYNADCLSFSGYERGGLTTEFTQFACNEVSDGLVRCGGLDINDGIAQFANGSLATINFTVTAVGLDEPDEAVTLDLQSLVDDIVDWSSSPGVICGGNCTCDINSSSNVSPVDALCAFQKYLGICPTSCGECDDVCSDVNRDAEVTPADALEIFRQYLGLESVCSGQ